MITRRSLLSLTLLPLLPSLDTQLTAGQESNAASMQATDIGLPDNVSDVRAMAMNANGEVLISAMIDDQPATFLYRDGAYQRIGGEDAHVRGVALNESGTAVGYSVSDEQTSAVLIGEDNLVTMPGDFMQSRALAINVEGQIAGDAVIADGDGFARPVYWTESSIKVLPSIGGRGAGAVLDSNTIAQMVGWSDADDDGVAGHATLWADGEATDLGALGGNLSEARGINEAGLIVGASLTSPEQNTFEEPGTAAFSWLDGQMTDLGLGQEHSWAVANDVNDVGMIVGAAGLTEPGPDGTERVAVLWSDREILDLNQITSGMDGLVLTEAAAVNAFGQILCRAVDADGNARIVILSVLGN